MPRKTEHGKVAATMKASSSPPTPPIRDNTQVAFNPSEFCSPLLEAELQVRNPRVPFPTPQAVDFQSPGSLRSLQRPAGSPQEPPAAGVGEPPPHWPSWVKRVGGPAGAQSMPSAREPC